MLFSIITPILNGAPFIKTAIASVHNQSHSDYEHIIVDGGSDDGSVDIVRKAAMDDPRIQLIERPGLGQYASIATGFDLAKGDILSWLNADDLYTPWALEAAANYADKHPDTQWLSGLPGCWDENAVLKYVRLEAWRPRYLIEQGWFHKDLLGFMQQESMFFTNTLFHDLSASERTAFENADLAGDYMLWKAFATRAPLKTLPSVLGGFRRHSGNRSVSGMNSYMNEVRDCGATDLPPPFRTFARFLFANISRWQTAKAVAKAELS